jgi:hypothetical protein
VVDRSRVRPQLLEYGFRQRFRVPASAAYAWATDFSEADWELAGIDGRRKVERLSREVVRLTDTIRYSAGGNPVKTRLVHLYPSERSWVSTHISGERIHSQFRYSVRASGPRASYLVFQGRELQWRRRPYGRKDASRVTAELRSADASLWRRFAHAMNAEYASAHAGARPKTRARR